jgi:hypothetical protein
MFGKEEEDMWTRIFASLLENFKTFLLLFSQHTLQFLSRRNGGSAANALKQRRSGGGVRVSVVKKDSSRNDISVVVVGF